MVVPNITEGTDKLLSELEAVKNHTQLKQERDGLAAENVELKRKLNQKHEQDARAECNQAIEILKEAIVNFNNAASADINNKEQPEKVDLQLRVNQLLEDELVRRIKAADEKQLLAVFVQAVNRQIEANKAIFTRERLQKAQALQYKNPFVALRGDWKIKCIECNSQHTLHLDFDTILLLLRGEAVEIPTSYSLHRFGLSVKLKDIVSHYLFGGQ